jgi:hypothetical protein
MFGLHVPTSELVSGYELTQRKDGNDHSRFILFLLDNLARVPRNINILFIGLFTKKYLLFVIIDIWMCMYEFVSSYSQACHFIFSVQTHKHRNHHHFDRRCIFIEISCKLKCSQICATALAETHGLSWSRTIVYFWTLNNRANTRRIAGKCIQNRKPVTYGYTEHSQFPWHTNKFPTC